MARSLVRVWPFLALALLAAPAAADVFQVTLSNGTTVETVYQPQEASWDSSMVLLLTEVGNWIGVPKAEIESVHNATQKGGFGVRINPNTVAIGWSANDAEDPSAVTAEGQPPGSELEARFQQAIQNLNQAIEDVQSRQDAQQSYTMDQFVEPGQTQGIPGGLINPYGSPPNQ
jgi:hypothetical protein